MKTSELIELLKEYEELDLDVVVNNYDDIEGIRLAPTNKLSLSIPKATDDYIKKRLMGVKNYLLDNHGDDWTRAEIISIISEM